MYLSLLRLRRGDLDLLRRLGDLLLLLGERLRRLGDRLLRFGDLLCLRDLEDDLPCLFGDLLPLLPPSCLLFLSFDKSLLGDRLPDFLDLSLDLCCCLMSEIPSFLGDLDLERRLGDLDRLPLLSFLLASTLDESLSWSADLSFSKLLLIEFESCLAFNSVLLLS